MSSPKDKRTLLFFGPTGVGKTDALRSLSDFYELISADSRQVYRGLDIGTAKPGAGERQRIRHHLIDICDPRDSWDVGQFVEAADRLIPQIAGRGRVPVVSGGTAFYLKGFLFGLPGTPRGSAKLRAELEHRLEQRGLAELRRELKTVDPEAERRIAENDRYRVLRALEVYHTAGTPLSSFDEPTVPREGVHARLVGVYRPREDLYDRINRRVEHMFHCGLPSEVAGLRDQGYVWTDPGMQTIGYREFGELGGDPPWSESTLRRIQDRIARNSRRYAKRQETFFRRLPGVSWVDATDPAALRRVLDTAVEGLYPTGSFFD